MPGKALHLFSLSVWAAIAWNVESQVCPDSSRDCSKETVECTNGEWSTFVNFAREADSDRQHHVCIEHTISAAATADGNCLITLPSASVRLSLIDPGDSCTTCCRSDGTDCCLSATYATAVQYRCPGKHHLPMSIRAYNNHRYAPHNYYGFVNCEGVTFKTYIFSVQTCEDDSQRAMAKVNQFYHDLKSRHLLQVESMGEESFFLEPTEKCYCYGICTASSYEERAIELQNLKRSDAAVIYVNSPDKVLRHAARRTLNLL